MKERIRPERWRHWEEVVRRWRESGRSVREFCHSAGLRESAFYFWRRRLVRRDRQVGGTRSPAEAIGATSAARRSKRASPLPCPPPSFLPLRVVEPSVTEAGPPLAVGGVEIVLGQGRTVRVRAGFDRQTLAEVLAMLEARPC
jgi:hypothetical protein